MSPQRLLLIALPAVALGLFAGAPAWTALPLLALSCLSALVEPRSTFTFPSSHRWLDGALIAACAIIALQLVPLPIVLRDLLSPQAASLASAVRLDAQTESSFAPLSIDPQSTWQALATMAIATVTFWSARGAFNGGSLRRSTRALIVVGGVLALVSMVLRAAAPGWIFLVWKPEDVAAKPFGPFVNRNHFAGWLVMAIPLAVGYLITHLRIHLRDEVQLRELARTFISTWAFPIGLSGVLMGLALFATMSRAAMVGLAVAAVMMWRLGHERLAGSRLMRRLVVLAAVGAVAILAMIDLDAITARFAATLADRPVDRTVIWRETISLIADFWLCGVGAGAYGTAMLIYQQTQVRLPHIGQWIHFNQAHSHYLQVPAEGGLLLTVAMAIGLVALVACGRQALGRDRGEISLVRVGAAAGLVGIAVQSIWETSLTIPANAIMGAILAGLLVHQRTPLRGA